MSGAGRPLLLLTTPFWFQLYRVEQSKICSCHGCPWWFLTSQSVFLTYPSGDREAERRPTDAVAVSVLLIDTGFPASCPHNVTSCSSPLVAAECVRQPPRGQAFHPVAVRRWQEVTPAPGLSWAWQVLLLVQLGRACALPFHPFWWWCGLFTR